MNSISNTPMNEAKLMDSFNCENTLRHVETCYIFREGVVFYKHCHEIAAGKELHDEIQVCSILERII